MGSFRKAFIFAGMLVISASSPALWQGSQITIDRALNSPTLTIRYSGASVALVELRLNGESIGTRAVSAGKSAGETTFNVNLTELKDGDNDVEVRLFDRAGKLVGTQKTNISTDQTNYGPVFLAAPKVGATVQGPVDIKVGFGRELRNTYVSFFIDGNFKSMSNYPPFNYLWDTAKESNGWHEVEAWVIDDTNTTYKTRKMRVFVNNPGGRTNRTGVATTAPVNNTIKAAIAAAESGTRAVAGASTAVAAVKTAVAPVVLTGTGNAVKASLAGSAQATRPAAKALAAIPSGPKFMTPTGARVAKAVAVKAPNLNAVTSAANLVAITKGQRLPNVNTFAIVLNSSYLKFDVAPRVDNGIPMTPFRHLLERAGGKVEWENLVKRVTANAEGREIVLNIGDATAQINKLPVSLEVAPYIDRGRTIVPLSFLRDALNVEVDYDKASGHVLITTKKK